MPQSPVYSALGLTSLDASARPGDEPALTAYVAGAPVAVYYTTRGCNAAEVGQTYGEYVTGLSEEGVYDPGYAYIEIRSCYDKARQLRALLHELLHAIDDHYRIKLTHDQVRQLASALANVYLDTRNAELVSHLAESSLAVN